MDREEHLAWCKKRALEYVDRGDLRNAWGSFVSDIQKHDETRDHMALNLGIQMQISGLLKTEHQMREFIEGFN